MGNCTKTALTRIRPILILMLFAGAARPLPVVAAEGQNKFSRTSLDVGLAVGDVNESVKFYKEAIGFREAKGFDMPGALAENFGLTAGEPLKVHVLVLGKEKVASRLKLIPRPSKEASQSTDEDGKSQPSFRYMTVFVADIDRVLTQLKEAGVKPLGDGPMQLGGDSPHEVFVVVVRDPDGNLVELVGPRGNDSR